MTSSFRRSTSRIVLFTAASVALGLAPVAFPTVANAGGEKYTLGEIRASVKWHRVTFKGKRRPMITSVRLTGPGVVGARTGVKCSSNRVCRRYKRGGSAKKVRISKNTVEYRNVNWVTHGLFNGEFAAKRFITVRAYRHDYIGRWIKITNSQREPNFRPSIYDTGCLNERGRILYQCPNETFNATLYPNEVLDNEHMLIAKWFSFESNLWVDSDGVMAFGQKCGFGIWNARFQTKFVTSTGGHPGAFLRMEGDGNLVLRSAQGEALWQTSTSGHPNARFVLGTTPSQPWGKIVEADDATKIVWQGADPAGRPPGALSTNCPL